MSMQTATRIDAPNPAKGLRFRFLAPPRPKFGSASGAQGFTRADHRGGYCE